MEPARVDALRVSRVPIVPKVLTVHLSFNGIDETNHILYIVKS